MQSRRWPHYLGDNMPVDLAELQRAMSQNNQAMVDFEATENPYTYAQELRGGQQLTPDATTGYLSPLMVLADTINQSTGRRDVRNLESERKGLSQTMAASQAMKESYDLEGEAQKRTFAQNQEDRSAAKEVRDATDHTALDKVEEFLHIPSKTNVVLRQDVDGNYVDGNGAVVNLDDYSGVVKEGNGYKYLGGTVLKDMEGMEHRVNSITRSADSAKDHYFQFDYDGSGKGGVPTEFMNKLFTSASKSGLLAYAENDQWNQQQQESMQWWAELLGDYSAEERHRLFGATLTPGEESSWENILGISKGMRPEDARAMLDTHTNRMRRSLAQKVTTYGSVVNIPSEISAMENIVGRNEWLKSGEYGKFTADPFTTANKVENGSGKNAQPNMAFDMVRQKLSDKEKGIFDQLNDANKQVYIDQLDQRSI